MLYHNHILRQRTLLYLQYGTENGSRSNLQFFQTPGVCQHLSGKPPNLLGGVFQSAGRFSLEQVEVGEEIMRTSPALQTRDKLQKYSIYSICDTRFIPFGLPGMLLTLVQEERFEVVAGHRVSWQIKVSIS